MSFPRLLLLSSLLVLAGCRWPVRERTEQIVHNLSMQPFDLAPSDATPQTEEKTAPPAKRSGKPAPETDIQTTALMQEEREPDKPGVRPKLELKIPTQIPGSEAPPINFEKMTREEKQRAIEKIYPELPALPTTPEALPGPDERPYTLAQLQKLAAENSPDLAQAASDVETAKGNRIAAAAYPNPTVGYAGQPTNNNSTTGAQGAYVQQLIKTFGKLKLATAAAQKDLDNAELALRRARSDLATRVRNTYYALLVAQETVRVGQALAAFTDEIYRLQTGYLAGGFAAPYEPAALRAQAYTTRLTYQQAISSYLYAWKQLVTALGLPQLPLSQVAGRIDRLIPYYDYDTVLARVLNRHTDVLTAQNGVDKARYTLKAAQITPYSDVEVQAYVFKETTLAPFSIFYTVQTSFTLPIWDQNRGNIIAAQGGLFRASEETHRVQMNLTSNLTTAYTNYKNNLDALEYYRRFILPDQVRFYRGVFDRRQVDLTAQFGDLVTAQQTLVTNVTAYLNVLGQLWTSVVGVADLLQTDDLFQLGKPQELPPLPDLNSLPRWSCRIPHSAPAVDKSEVAAPSPAAGEPVLPAPRRAGPVVPPADALPESRTRLP